VDRRGWMLVGAALVPPGRIRWRGRLLGPRHVGDQAHQRL